MSGFVTFLIIVALIVVVLEYTDRHRRLYVGRAAGGDRDRARRDADLVAHRD